MLEITLISWDLSDFFYLLALFFFNVLRKNVIYTLQQSIISWDVTARWTATEVEINLYLTSVCLFPGSHTSGHHVSASRFQGKIFLIPDPTWSPVQTLEFQYPAHISG